MTRARPSRTLPRQSFGCCLALFTWIAAAAAQNIPPTDPRQIADAITQLCMADRSVRVRTETMGRDLLVRSVDANGNLKGEFTITESRRLDVYGGIQEALRRAGANQADGLRACLGSLPMELTARNTQTAAPVESPPLPDTLTQTQAIRQEPPLPNTLTPVRSYFRAADIPPPEVGAYGVIALRGKPTSASRARLFKVCASFTTHLPRAEALPKFVPLKDRMLTIWPLDDPSAPEAKADDCKFAIEHYDLYGGLSAIQDAKRQGAKLDGRGPFLIGWSPASSRGSPDRLVLVVDLSPFESQDSFDSAFLFWQKKIVEDPMLWRSGFSIEGIRLAIRDFVDRYGQDVMKATRLWGIKVR